MTITNQQAQLFDAMSNIDSQYITQALEKNVRFSGGVIRRIAAVAATVAILIGAALFPWENEEGEYITAPGVLKVYANDITTGTNSGDMGQFEITDSVDSYRPFWSPYINMACVGIPLFFQFPDDYYAGAEITLDIRAEHGEFLELNEEFSFEHSENENLYLHLGDQVTVENGEQIFWDGISLKNIREQAEDNGLFFLDILIKADGVPVGFGIISLLYTEEPVAGCVMTGAKTVCYPMQEGEYQKITEEHLYEQMEKNHLLNMSTEALVDRILYDEKPIKAGIFSSTEYYHQAIYNRYADILYILESRTDAGNVLLRKFLDLYDLLETNIDKFFEDFDNLNRLTILKHLLDSDAFQQQLTPEEKQIYSSIDFSSLYDYMGK